MTPLELDLQLQCTELIFRSLLEGKRLRSSNEDVESWSKKTMGEAWSVWNERMRDTMAVQQDQTGENTPEWLEALSDIGDLAWEVFDHNGGGEVLRRQKDIDRTEVLALLGDLYPKVKLSFYARCGFGHKKFGMRTCIALLRLFVDDPQVLDLGIGVLTLAISDVMSSACALTELTLPLPPASRPMECGDRGWSFLRAAFDVYLVQLGNEPWSWRPSDTNLEPLDDDESSDEEDRQVNPFKGGCLDPKIDRTPRKMVAFRMAECIVATQRTPAVQVQMRLLAEPAPDDAPVDRKELEKMLPVMISKTEELIAAGGPAKVLNELLAMLRLGTTGSARTPPEGLDEDSTGSNKGVLSSMMGGVRGLLGRGSAS